MVKTAGGGCSGRPSSSAPAAPRRSAWSAESCAAQCRGDRTCAWFSFVLQSRRCTLLTECTMEEEEEGEEERRKAGDSPVVVVSGMRDCTPGKEMLWHKVAIIDGPGHRTEFMDLVMRRPADYDYRRRRRRRRKEMSLSSLVQPKRKGVSNNVTFEQSIKATVRDDLKRKLRKSSMKHHKRKRVSKRSKPNAELIVEKPNEVKVGPSSDLAKRNRKTGHNYKSSSGRMKDNQKERPRNKNASSKQVKSNNKKKSKDKPCGLLSPLPKDAWGAAAAFVGGAAVVCGGGGGAQNGRAAGVSSACLVYAEYARAWRDVGLRLTVGRTGAASVVVAEDKFWLTGGRDRRGRQLRSTELLDASSLPVRSVPFSDLPSSPLELHSLVDVGGGRFLLAGGKPLTAETWIFDLRWKVRKIGTQNLPTFLTSFTARSGPNSPE